MLQEIEDQHLDTARNMLKTMQLKPQIRQQLTLLLQRQHLEEQELRLRHYMELEKFHKGLGELMEIWIDLRLKISLNNLFNRRGKE